MNEKLKKIEPKTAEQFVGWLDIRLPQSTIDRLTEYIIFAREKNKEIPLFSGYDTPLEGHIVTTYSLEDEEDWFFQSILNQTIIAYHEAFPEWIKKQSTLTADCEYKLEKFWTNIQHQNEIIPAHTHHGIFAFTIWINIPFEDNADSRSTFYFQYSDILGGLKADHFNLTPEDAGRMLFFPANLHHGVYPFHNSDLERISISGNIKYDPKKIVKNPLAY